jgi:hypothetical protein
MDPHRFDALTELISPIAVAAGQAVPPARQTAVPGAAVNLTTRPAQAVVRPELIVPAVAPARAALYPHRRSMSGWVRSGGVMRGVLHREVRSQRTVRPDRLTRRKRIGGGHSLKAQRQVAMEVCRVTGALPATMATASS